jgi:hypothetical protein
MNVPPYVPPPAVSPQEVIKLVSATQTNAAASIASAIITASGRPHSVEEALNILRDIHFSLFPAPGNGIYEQWKKTSKLDEVHK